MSFHELPQPSPDGSYQLGPFGPLRLVRSGRRREIANEHHVFEMLGNGDESVVMSRFPYIPETVRFTITDMLTPKDGFLPFVRELLYTRSGDRRLVTMSGYLMTDHNIRTTGNFNKKDMERFSENFREQVRLARTVEMEHVRGFEAASARHLDRVKALGQVTPLDMREAQLLYEALVYGH